MLQWAIYRRILRSQAQEHQCSQENYRQLLSFLLFPTHSPWPSLRLMTLHGESLQQRRLWGSSLTQLSESCAFPMQCKGLLTSAEKLSRKRFDDQITSFYSARNPTMLSVEGVREIATPAVRNILFQQANKISELLIWHHSLTLNLFFREVLTNVMWSGTKSIIQIFGSHSHAKLLSDSWLWNYSFNP